MNLPRCNRAVARFPERRALALLETLPDRRAGQGARERFHRLLILWAVTSVLALIAGVVARWAAHYKIPIFWLVLGAVVAPLVLDRSFERELFNWLGGARGEEQVGDALKQLESAGFHAVHDVEVRGIGNIDHVVFGPTGTFVIETKAWNGTVYPGKGGRLMCNGQDRHKHLKQATREAVEVGKRLKKAGFDMWVHPVIVLTRARMKKPDLVFDRIHVITLKRLPEFLRGARGRHLDARSVHRCVEAVSRVPDVDVRAPKQ